MQYVFIQGTRRLKKRSGRVGAERRGPPEVVSSASAERSGADIARGSGVREKGPRGKEKGGVSRNAHRNHRRGRYTGESDSKVDRKIVSTAKRPWSLNEEGKKGRKERETRRSGKGIDWRVSREGRSSTEGPDTRTSDVFFFLLIASIASSLIVTCQWCRSANYRVILSKLLEIASLSRRD